MYYFLYKDSIVCTPDKELAEKFSDITHIPEALPTIDFGGSLCGKMRVSEVMNYSFYSHHFTQLVNALRAGLNNSPYVILDTNTIPFIFTKEKATELLNTLKKNWYSYLSDESYNMEAWEEAMSVLNPKEINHGN